MAVKQYAWYHAVYSSRTADGRCYDVRDGTTDQLYKPGRARISSDHYNAVDATWNVTIRKDGRFIMTGYRRGEKVRCGRDSTGYKLFAMSGVDCARKGLGWRQILRTYYGPGLSLVGDGVTSSSTDARRAAARDQRGPGLNGACARGGADWGDRINRRRPVGWPGRRCGATRAASDVALAGLQLTRLDARRRTNGHHRSTGG